MTAFVRAWLDEYRKIAGDAGAVLILVGAVLLYAVIYPFPYCREVLCDVPVAVVDLDRSPLSRQLIRAIDATQAGAVTDRPADLAAARRLFARGRVKGICLIPEDFARRLNRGETATVIGYCDGSYVYLYKAVARSLAAAVGDLSARLEVRSLTAVGFSTPAAMKQRDPLPLELVHLFNPAGGYASYLVPAIFVMILQQTLLMGIGLLDGTENESTVAHPQGRRLPWPAVAARILGRAGAHVSGHLVLGYFLLGGMIRWHRYPQRGSMTDVLLFILPLLLGAVFLGITLARWFPTRESALPVLLSVSMPLVFLSGFSWPSHAMPAWLQLLAQAVPSTSAIQGFYAINHMGASLSEVMGLWGRLWALAGIYFISACMVTRQRTGRKKARACFEITAGRSGRD